MGRRVPVNFCFAVGTHCARTTATRRRRAILRHWEAARERTLRSVWQDTRRHALQHGADDLAGPAGDGDAQAHQSKYRSISARRGCLRSLSARENYLPVNSRLWAINEGEVSLSRTMVPLAESIDIIYKPNNLRVSLNAVQTLDSRMNLARLIPIPIRSQNSEICSLTQSEVTRFFISKIGGGSQIHTGGFIYRKYNQCPLIKRDLLYRDQFTINEIEEALIETGHEDHFDEIMTDFRKKGKASQLPIIKRLQAASGII